MSFVDRHRSRSGQARRSSRPARRPFHASFVCVSWVLSTSRYKCSGLGWCCCWMVDLQFTFQRLAIVCLEREESMRKSWMQVLDAGSALYV